MSNKIICPDCGSENTSRVLAAGLPMKLCLGCNTLWREPFVTIYTLVVAPIEMWINGYCAFLAYYEPGFTGYLKALWVWIKGGPDDNV